MDDKDAHIAALDAELAERTRERERDQEIYKSISDNYFQSVMSTEDFEAMKKDAARYQWLKINARRIDFAGLCVSDGAQLDARIDDAMSKNRRSTGRRPWATSDAGRALNAVAAPPYRRER